MKIEGSLEKKRRPDMSVAYLRRIYKAVTVEPGQYHDA
jgi:hypothetical protein